MTACASMGVWGPQRTGIRRGGDPMWQLDDAWKASWAGIQAGVDLKQISDFCRKLNIDVSVIVVREIRGAWIAWMGGLVFDRR